MKRNDKNPLLLQILSVFSIIIIFICLSVTSKDDDDIKATDDVINLDKVSSVFSKREESKHQNRSTEECSDDVTMTDDDEMLMLEAEMKEFDFSSLKSMSFNSVERQLGALLSWKSVSRSQMEIPARLFDAFLPPHLHNVVATPYWLYTRPHPPDVTSWNHFRAPAGWDSEDHVVALISRILSMFHPRPFAHIRHDPGGAAAVVSAQNEEFFKIIFRFHCEFQLNNEEEDERFWLTPAQFSGQLIISKYTSHVHYFTLHLPNDRKVNVDLEWSVNKDDVTRDDGIVVIATRFLAARNNNRTTTDGGESVVEEGRANVGFSPLMRIESRNPSMTRLIDDGNATVDWRKLRAEGHDVEFRFDDVIFDDDDAISDDAALDMLGKFFYPFKQVEYFDLEDAMEECAAKRDKLLHHVILWGNLDDQSC